MKRKLICTILWLFLLATPAYAAQEEDYSDLLPGEVQQVVEQQAENVEAFEKMTLSSLINGAINALRDNMAAPLKLLAKVTAILLLSAVFKQFIESSASSGVTLAVESVTNLTLFAMLCMPMLALVSTTHETITACETLIISFVPAFCTLSAASGHAASASVVSGFFMSGILFFSKIIGAFLLPFMQIFLAFSVVGSISDAVNLGKLATAMAKSAKWLLILFATLFASVLTLQSVVGSAGDTFTMKAGKMVVSSAVPVIGKAMSDALGTVYAGLKVVRTGAGLAGIIAIVVMFAPPLASCAAYLAVVYCMQFAAEVLGAGSASAVLHHFVECLQIYISVILLYSVLVIFAVVLLINVGGVA